MNGKLVFCLVLFGLSATKSARTKSRQLQDRSRDPITGLQSFPYERRRHESANRNTFCTRKCQCYPNAAYCANQRLNHIPVVFPRDIELLHLENNNIKKIPPNLLFNFSRLRKIYLNKNNITSSGINLFSFKGLSLLKQLDLSDNKLIKVPRNLPESLVELSLNGNQIREISHLALQHLINLKTLNLYDNDLRDFGIEPGVFAQLTLLINLDLSKNFLTTIPIGLPRNLEDLRIEENLIKNFSAEIFSNGSLIRHVTLRANQLTDISMGVDIWQNMTNLRVLDLSTNRLRIVPRGLPTSLQQLILEENKIEEINVRTFASIPDITHIRLSFNLINLIVPGSFAYLDKLQYLDLAFNQIIYVPQDLPRNLEILDLSSNRIRYIQYEVFCPGYMTRNSALKLRHVILINNYISISSALFGVFECAPTLQLQV